MIDIHCHILPGVDDGSDSLETSVEMAKLAWEQGTDLIVATPHCCRPDQDGLITPALFAQRLGMLRRALREAECPLKLAAGMEVFSTPALPDLLDRHLLLTLGGTRYFLLEFAFDERHSFMEACLQTVVDHGLHPVVAHPERYHAVQRDPAIAAAWFRRGFLLQVNKGSILGRLGAGAEETGWWLLKRGLAHAVASDAHRVTYRSPSLSHVRDVLGEALSWEYTKLLLETNPRRILKNQTIVSVEDFLRDGKKEHSR